MLTTRRDLVGGGLGLGAVLGSGLLPASALAKAQSAEIPIKVDGNTPWTGVWINGVGPFRFQIQTRGNVFVVSAEVAEKLQLPQKAEVVAGSGPNAHLAKTYVAKEVLIGGQLPLQDVRLLESKGWNGSRYAGVMPTPVDRISIYEFGAGRLRYATEPPPELAQYARIPLMPTDNDLGFMARVEGRLAGRPVRLRINTSSSLGLTLYPDAVKRLNLWSGPEPSYDRRARFSQTDSVIRTVRRGDLTLQGLTFQRPLMSLYDPADAVANHSDDDGDIGMELLRRVDLAFHPRKLTAWMRPTAAMSDPWRHDRAGFTCALKDGGAAVDQVDPGSPAAKAGLVKGVKLVGLGKQDVERLMAAQQGAAGTRIAFDVEQDGQARRVSLLLEDRI